MLSQVLLVPMTAETTALPDVPDRWQEVSGTIGLPVFDRDGVRSVPAFTSVAEFARWAGSEDARYIALPAPGLFEIFLQSPADRLVVDNAGNQAFVIDRDQARALLDVASAVPDDAPVMALNSPPSEAAQLVEALRGACARYPEIHEAYLYRAFETTRAASMRVPDDAWQLTLLYAFEPETSDERIRAIVREIGESLRQAASERPGMMPSGVAVLVMRGDSDWLKTVSRSGASLVAAGVQVTCEYFTGPVLEGKPSRKPPPALLDVVRRIGEADPAVIAATYHQVAFLDRDDGPQLAIGLRLRPGIDQDRANAIASALGAALAYDKWDCGQINILIESADAPREHRTTILHRH